MRSCSFLVLLLVACGADPPEPGSATEICDNPQDDGRCAEICDNQQDDDLDGRVDCFDDDCDGRCAESCGDGRDNDGDGAIDCDDTDCLGSCAELCGDGLDNDGDGKVDCLDEECSDPSCSEDCTDGRDNDADGRVDCDDDDCSVPACDEDCADGRDNDADGAIDCDDPDCDRDCIEVCTDGRDNDADGRVDCDDEECSSTCDADADGFVSVALGGDDCDDTNREIHPERPELCNGPGLAWDDDCDGRIDEDDPDLDPFSLVAWGPDADGDGYGTGDDLRYACQAAAGWGLHALDCDDTRADIHPGMPEVCSHDETVDDDCDGRIDDADPDLTEGGYLEWFADGDGDGFGGDESVVLACSRPDGTAPSSDDCDDTDPTVGPPSLWFADEDRDGFGAGDPIAPTPTCDPPSPLAQPDWIGLDCDDGEPTTFPGAEEICEDGIDQDCDGEDRPCIAPNPECSDYTELSDAWRNVTWEYDMPRCDNILRGGWYRVTGEAGTEMLDYAPGDYSCGTHAPGWLDGHPELDLGETTDHTVCYDWSGPGDDCTWSHDIRVTNCGPFYVYDLIPTPWGCSGVYCGHAP